MRKRIQLNILLNHEPTGRFGLEVRVFLMKGRGETMRHVLMKLLGFLVYHEDGMAIEASANQHYKPDVVSFRPDGQPRTWIDCGTTGLPKLDKITHKNRETRFVIVKPSLRELRNYRIEAIRQLAHPEMVLYLAPRQGWIPELDAVLAKRHEVVATVSGRERAQHLYLTVDGVSVDTPVLELPGLDIPVAA